MMLLFTQTFLQKLKRTYDGTLNPIIGLATLSHNEELRIRIEEWLIDIPEAAQIKLIKKFRSDHENTASFVVELLVGSMLARRGFKIQYEPQFGSQTPDWLITDGRGKKAIVEVLNLNMPEDTKNEWQRVSDIHSKLSKYPQPVAFSVRCKSLFMDVSEFEEIGQWLSSRPSQGQVLRTANAELEIAYWNEKYTHAQPIGPSATYWGA